MLFDKLPTKSPSDTLCNKSLCIAHITHTLARCRIAESPVSCLTCGGLDGLLDLFVHHGRLFEIQRLFFQPFYHFFLSSIPVKFQFHPAPELLEQFVPVDPKFVRQLVHAVITIFIRFNNLFRVTCVELDVDLRLIRLTETAAQDLSSISTARVMSDIAIGLLVDLSLFVCDVVVYPKDIDPRLPFIRKFFMSTERPFLLRVFVFQYVDEIPEIFGDPEVNDAGVISANIRFIDIIYKTEEIFASAGLTPKCPNRAIPFHRQRQSLVIVPHEG